MVKSHSLSDRKFMKCPSSCNVYMVCKIVCHFAAFYGDNLDFKYMIYHDICFN